MHAQRQRKKVEALFAELKNQDRAALRRMKFVREQFFLAAASHIPTAAALEAVVMGKPRVKPNYRKKPSPAQLSTLL